MKVCEDSENFGRASGGRGGGRAESDALDVGGVIIIARSGCPGSSRDYTGAPAAH